MPGRFHPFHKGHAAGYQQLVDEFGPDNTYLAISAKQESPKSPFSAKDRSMMAQVLGVPSDKIIVVNQPYRNEEYINKFSSEGISPENTVLVFGVSKKDMEGDPEKGIPPDPRFSFAPKKDGSPAYMQPYAGSGKQDPMTKHAYIISTDVGEFPIAGKSMRDASSIRSAYAAGDDRTKDQILKDLYGKAARSIKPIFDENLLSLAENLRVYISALRPLINEATTEQKIRLHRLLDGARYRLNEYNVKKTQKFIKKAHRGQLYGDLPYDTHPRAVAALGRRLFGPKFGPEAVKVALLHDVLEDTAYTPEQLEERGFSPDVIQAVELLTKKKGLSYADNIKLLIDSGNQLAMMVKYCDNYMNYTGDKSNWDPAKALASQKKYLASLDMLGKVLGVDHHSAIVTKVTESSDYLSEK